MKIQNIIILILFSISVGSSVLSQSIITTSTGKSGILVDSEDNFAGINFENANNELSLNYKTVNQDSLERGDKDPLTNNLYPDLKGLNIEVASRLKENESELISEEMWQGNVKLGITRFFTKTNFERESKEPNGNIADLRGNIKQRTTYYSYSHSLSRVNGFEIDNVRADSTFISLNNPLNSTSSFTLGHYRLFQKRSNYFASWSLSLNTRYLTKSSRGLKKKNLSEIPTSNLVLSSKDTTNFNLSLAEKTLFEGDLRSEFTFTPRFDIFLRWKLNDELPILGLYMSYGHLFSSLDRFKNIGSIAIGPTFGLRKNPDHVVFSILNEFNENQKRCMEV